MEKYGGKRFRYNGVKSVLHYPGYMFIVYDSCLRFCFLKFDNLDS